MKHDRINEGLLLTSIVSLLVCIIGLVIFLTTKSKVHPAPFYQWLEDISDFIMDKLIIWIPGSLFVVYFVCVALFQFIGINIGPKNKID